MNTNQESQNQVADDIHQKKKQSPESLGCPSSRCRKRKIKKIITRDRKILGHQSDDEINENNLPKGIKKAIHHHINTADSFMPL